MSELKPCPFCGGPAEISQIGNEATAKRGFQVVCATWGCRTTKRAMVIRQPLERAREFTIAAWNRRAEPVPPPAQEAAGAVTREELITLIDQHVEAHCTYADDLYVIGQEDAADAILSRLGGAIQEPEEGR